VFWSYKRCSLRVSSSIDRQTSTLPAGTRSFRLVSRPLPGSSRVLEKNNTFTRCRSFRSAVDHNLDLNKTRSMPTGTCKWISFLFKLVILISGHTISKRSLGHLSSQRRNCPIWQECVLQRRIILMRGINIRVRRVRLWLPLKGACLFPYVQSDWSDLECLKCRELRKFFHSIK